MTLRSSSCSSDTLSSSWTGCGKFASNIVLVTGLSLLTACAAPKPGSGVNDPYEGANRQIHGFNVAVDRAVFGPDAGPSPLPRPVSRGLANFVDNLSTPSYAVNSLLQGRSEPLVKNTFRFVINTTVGIGGIFDPAGALGLTRKPTDFGETLAVWGAPEGAFVMLPFKGPSTGRDTAGLIVDTVIDPIGVAVGWPDAGYLAGVRLGNKIDNRLIYSATISSILYESADSYSQLRLLYLQNRRFELGQQTDLIDPYEDPYAQ